MAISATRGSTAYFAAPVSAIAGAAFPTIAGSTLVVAVSLADTTSSVSSITDNAGNTFHHMVDASNDGNVRVEIWQSQGIIGYAVNYVTVSFSTPTICSMVVWEFSGVHVETYPSPQDIATASNFNTQLTCGTAASDISSWVICVFGWPNPATSQFQFLYPVRGTEIDYVPNPNRTPVISSPNVVASMLYVRPYAAPLASPNFVVPTPLGNLAGSQAPDPRQYAAATLELRAAGSTGGGGITPPLPIWLPPPAGTLVSWSFTYTVEESAPAAAITADVTCSYLETVCDDDRTEPGNDAY